MVVDGGDEFVLGVEGSSGSVLGGLDDGGQVGLESDEAMVHVRLLLLQRCAHRIVLPLALLLLESDREIRNPPPMLRHVLGKTTTVCSYVSKI